VALRRAKIKLNGRRDIAGSLSVRALTIGVSLTLLAGPASAIDTVAPAETVTVESDSPIGLWKFNLPQSFDLHGVVGKAEWGPMADEFCQIEKMHTELTVHCLGLRVGGQDVSRGRLSIKGDHIRMVWGSMWTYLAINGTMRSAAQFAGTISASHLGISSDDPDKVTGTKLFLVASTPDSGGKSALLTRLLDQMTRGTVTEPTAMPTPNAVPNKPGAYIRLLKPDTLEALGGLQSITYLGDGGLSPPLSFYDVEFVNGHLICSLRQNSEGTLDQFDCG
jgi:hypothetical protein